MFKRTGIIGLIVLALTQIACESDTLVATCDITESVTYDSQIKEIIAVSSTSSRCNGNGSSNGDYTTFSGMSSVISNGNLKKEVLDNQTMPQGDSFSQDEINLFKCWVENGYQKN